MLRSIMNKLMLGFAEGDTDFGREASDKEQGNIGEQILDMVGRLHDEPTVEESKVEPKVEPKPAKPAPTEPEAKVKEPVVEPKAPSEPPKEPPKEAPPQVAEPTDTSDAEELRKNYSVLAALAMKAGIKFEGGQPVIQPVSQPTPPTVAPQPTPSKVEQPQASLDEVPFLATEEAYSEAFRDQNAFNRVLNQVRNNAIKEALLRVNQLVVPVVQQEIAMREMVRSFYSANPDLEQHAAVVGLVVNELQARNPGMTQSELFVKAADEARTRLRMKKAVAAPQPKPAFAKTGGARVPTPEPSKFDKEFKELKEL